MCSAFYDNWKRQEARETRTLELKEFQNRAERLSFKLRGAQP